MSPADRFLLSPAFLFGLLLGALAVGGGAVQPVLAQNSVSQQDKAMHYSLYYESFKNDEFAAAKKDLNWIIENAPGFPNGDDRNFRRKYELYVGLAEKASGSAQQQAYLDTAVTLLETAPKKMDSLGLNYEKFEWEIRRGRFLQEHQQMASNLKSDVLKTPKAHYAKAFKMAPKQVNPYYIQQALQGYLENNQQKKALQFLEQVQAKRGDDEEVSKIIASTRQSIFGRNPQAKVNYLEKQYKAHPDSAKIMQSLFNAYVRQGNIAKASKLAPKLMETNPPAETVREVANMRLENGRPKAALKAYQKAQKQGAELTADDYFNRGKAYQQMDSFAKARQEYRKALEMNPKFAEAYVAIGDLYARAVSQCSGSELSRKDKAVYWAAVDKYRKAMEVDSSIASVVESKIRSYRKVFPSKEDIFYREDWEQGETFTIDYGCYSWINETTSVRSAS
ncbi:MAG: tetratricopeptide repeat protein [Salinibacter sp.]